MKNTGKASQQQFEDMIRFRWGKLGFVWRMTDAAEVRGMNEGKFSVVKKQPADYIVTLGGQMAYAEVKSTTGTRLRRSCLEQGQLAACKQQLRAGGYYWVFVHFIRTNTWYWMSGRTFIDAPDAIKSWSEKDLKECKVLWNRKA